MKAPLNKNGKQLHKIFHPSRWKDIDKMTVYSNYLTYQGNWNGLQNQIKSWIIVAGGFVYIADYTLLRLSIEMNRIYIIAFALCLIPVSILTDWFFGKSEIILRLQNFIARAMRRNNDTEMANLIRQVDEMHMTLKYHDTIIIDVHKMLYNKK